MKLLNEEPEAIIKFYNNIQSSNPAKIVSELFSYNRDFKKTPSLFGEYELNKKNWTIIILNYTIKIFTFYYPIKEDDPIDLSKLKQLILFVCENKQKGDFDIDLF